MRLFTPPINVFAGALAVTLLALSADAQEPQCQAQWDQKCINTGWHFGSTISCTSDPVTNGNFNTIRQYCWKNSPATDNRIHGASLHSFTGTGWFKPSGYNSWNFYPAYFENGRIYVQARCRTGNMGTTMTWGKHPHDTPSPSVIIPVDNMTVPCPPS